MESKINIAPVARIGWLMAKPLFKVLGGLEETSLDTTIAVKRHMKGFVAAGKPLMQGRSNPIEVISLTEVGRLRKNDTTEIVIQKTEFRGSVGIDIREYVTSDRYTGWSKNGIRIPVEKWLDFKAVLDQVETTAKADDPDMDKKST